MANVLLLIAITFLVASVAAGSAALLEHPAFSPKHDALEAPSIWRLDMLNCLLTLPASERHLVMQGYLGGVSMKPTNFQSVGLPTFPDFVKLFSKEPAPGELITLVGKDSEGSFKTAAAKEYPATLCKVIAYAGCTAIREAKRGPPVGHFWTEQLQKFYVPFDGYGTCGFGADHWIEDSFDPDSVAYTLSA